jgi:two-component system, NarL family, sensor histidine kinase BarA
MADRGVNARSRRTGSVPPIRLPAEGPGHGDVGDDAEAVGGDEAEVIEDRQAAARAGTEADAAHAAICRAIGKLDPVLVAECSELSLVEAAQRLEALVDERTQELGAKTAALEGANHELRSLTTNLDQIVRQRTRALAESESQLRRKTVELDRLNRMKAEFISIAAHELRTPMTSIVGYLDLFAERAGEELSLDARRQLESLRRNAHRLKRLIEDMLDVSNLENGTVALRRAPCALGEIVLGVVAELRPLAEDKLARLGTHLADVPAIDADADKLHQAISNLLANALKYLGCDGEIALTVDGTEHPATGARVVRLRVRSQGAGVSAARRARMFEPFSEVNAAKHHASGGPDPAGLGLRIARGIIELHGGTLQLDSEEGSFTEFTALLPLG